ncbi:S-adenosyl-L-methionine-dependent methyltransferase [Mycena haematopus]|nr:S-adenosyl-L-methionine-dependent methyltransferase [Mycena haematopus]
MFSSSIGQSEDEAHSHTHTHSHSHEQSGWTSENVHLYEQQSIAAKIGDEVPRAMRKAYPFNEETTTVMDFACGTGIQFSCILILCSMLRTCRVNCEGLGAVLQGGILKASHELVSDQRKSIVGVDINPAMVAHFAEKIHNQGIPPEEMRVVCANLKGVESELDGQKFDVIVCSAAYHHFKSINNITRTLSFFLKPGGCLLVADFMQSAEPVPEDVPNKRGFTEEDIQGAFVGAGLEDVSIDPFTEARFHGQIVKLFLAKGTKPTP